MAKLHSGVSELKAAHKNLRTAAAQGSGAAFHILLFYSAECGLKSAYLRSQNLRSTAQLEDSDLTHDFSRLIIALKLPKTFPKAPVFRLSKDDSKSRHHSDAHQAWRYGIRIHPDDEEQVVSWLNSICDSIKEYL